MAHAFFDFELCDRLEAERAEFAVGPPAANNIGVNSKTAIRSGGQERRVAASGVLIHTTLSESVSRVASTCRNTVHFVLWTPGFSPTSCIMTRKAD